MKKWTVLLAAAILTLSLGACGAPAPAASGTSASEASSEASIAAESLKSASEVSSSQNHIPPQEKTQIRIAALKGPTAIGMVKLMEDAAKGETKNDYQFTLAGAPDELVGKIVQGDFDVAAVPTNLAATLYQKTEGRIKLAALNTMGVLYIVENGDTIKTMEDLKGKTIYATGKGSTPEFALNYILEKNGLSDQVKVEYRTEHTELANLIAAGQADVVLLPQPFVTSVMMQNEAVRVALDLTQEWEKASQGGSGLAMGAVIIQKKFLEEHPEAIDVFMEEYKASVVYVTDAANLDAAAELVVAQGIIPKAPIAKKAIPACNIVFVSGEEMKQTVSGFLQVLFEANPQSVGGKLPDEAFYYLW